MDKKKKNARSYKRFQYSAEDLEKALYAVHNGLISANKASQEYHIPKGTLINIKFNKVYFLVSYH